MATLTLPRRRTRDAELHQRRNGAGSGRTGPLRAARDDGDPDEHSRGSGQPEPGHPPRGPGPYIDIGSSTVTFATDFVGLAFHGDCHTHMDALCHIAYQGRVLNGRPAQYVMTSQGATALDVTTYREGLVGKGVLLDMPRFRGVRWLEPGEAVTRAELEAVEQAEGVRLGEGDILVSRTAHHRRRLELGGGATTARRQAKARRVCTSTRSHGWTSAGSPRSCPTAMGRLSPPTSRAFCIASARSRSRPWACSAAGSPQLEDPARACEKGNRFEFMVVGLPLRLPGGTGSPWNPIAIF